MIEILITGVVLNSIAALAIVYKDKRAYDFFELIPIPYAMVLLIAGFMLFDRV